MRDDERAAAAEAVRSASMMCAAVQGHLTAGDTLIKSDHSPVTVADYASQAVVVMVLADRLGVDVGQVPMIGEEDSTDLASRSELLDSVVATVRIVLPHADRDTVVDAITAGDSAERCWTLDPIDGTKGFLRGDQYAVALALLDSGTVELGVLGCPNLSNSDGSRGAMFVADRSGTEMHRLGATDAAHGGSGGSPGAGPVSVGVASPRSVADAVVCESVESAHSDHTVAARIVRRLGIESEPFRIDSQCKYAAVARGDASIYLRLPTSADYREKIWDHAAGSKVVEQAGGRVTDVNGIALDFSNGHFLQPGTGVVATSGAIHDEVVAAVRAELAPR